MAGKYPEKVPKRGGRGSAAGGLRKGPWTKDQGQEVPGSEWRNGRFRRRNGSTHKKGFITSVKRLYKGTSDKKNDFVFFK